MSSGFADGNSGPYRQCRWLFSWVNSIMVRSNSANYVQGSEQFVVSAEGSRTVIPMMHVPEMPEQRRSPAHVIVCGDDVRRGEFLKSEVLSSHHVSMMDSGELVDRARGLGSDLIILDLIPTDSLALCRRIRRDPELNSVPLLVLVDDESAQVAAMGLGAVDCLSRNAASDLIRFKSEHLLGWKKSNDKLKQAVKRAEHKVAELESFLQMVAHDLKSPAVAVSGFVKLLKKNIERGEPDPKLEEILGHLSTASDSIHDFLQDIAHFLISERIDLKLDAVRIDNLVREVIRRHEPLLADRSITLRTTVSGASEAILADARRLGQVMDNLLVNAIVHMGDNPEPFIHVTVENTRERVIICVADNGQGVPPEHRDKIFEKFYRVPKERDKPGTGLGLAISRTIVESHGGVIWVEPNTGRGSTFCFTLPRGGPAGEIPPATGESL